ncbi:MAG: restriction endonuclease subunit S [Brevibacterium aurantiacum]|uniref:restriction endonuclease subunit S n=1 Tax=Brevibacterium aurantiacum TaxID=273384 RepID=UPI003F8DF453
MTRVTLGEAFLLNPTVKLAKGTNSPFVEMASLVPFTRDVAATQEKPYGGGMKFCDGDVLMARITPSLENGKTSIYRAAPNRRGVPAFGSTEFIVVRGREGVSSTDFAYYLFTSKNVRDHAIASMNGSSGRQRVQHDSLASLEIDLPELSEQRAIAATLGAIDDKIESNRRAISLIDGLVRARFEATFDLTQTSRGVSIAELVNVNRRLTLTRGTVATYIGMSSLPEFSPSVLYWEKREFGSGQKFMNGDVLMARITPCLENGKTAVVDMLEEGEVGWGSTEYVVLGPKGSISTPWIYALVRHPDLREWAVRRMSGTSGRQRFQADGFADYIISEPGLANLDDFNNFALPLFERIAQLRDEIRKLASVRDTLLPELLSGRIRVPAEGVEA